ncbi:MAG: hypothetical protein BWX69_03253 [Planctomycetes bacterium ADurb.Bin069]|nr:MAG: hypothetical protein BWX69_03253 [Planctomycetes bacterium ADurb.Bin069]
MDALPVRRARGLPRGGRAALAQRLRLLRGGGQAAGRQADRRGVAARGDAGRARAAPQERGSRVVGLSGRRQFPALRDLPPRVGRRDHRRHARGRVHRPRHDGFHRHRALDRQDLLLQGVCGEQQRHLRRVERGAGDDRSHPDAVRRRPRRRLAVGCAGRLGRRNQRRGSLSRRFARRAVRQRPQQRQQLRADGGGPDRRGVAGAALQGPARLLRRGGGRPRHPRRVGQRNDLDPRLWGLGRAGRVGGAGGRPLALARPGEPARALLR